MSIEDKVAAFLELFYDDKVDKVGAKVEKKGLYHLQNHSNSMILDLAIYFMSIWIDMSCWLSAAVSYQSALPIRPCWTSLYREKKFKTILLLCWKV